MMIKLSRIFQGIGASFLIMSLGLTVYNINQDNQAQKFSDSTVQTLLQEISKNAAENVSENISENTVANASENILENTAESASENVLESASENISGTLSEELSEELTENTWQDILEYPWENNIVNAADLEMPIQQINDMDYIGVLEIPDLSLTLPILDDWSYAKLKMAPCRYSGTSYQDNFVILAHNYASHFGKLQDLAYGQLVTFTDIDGNVSKYQVSAIEIFEPTQVEEMVAGLGDLTLFTCTVSGSSRVTVGCDRIQ